MNSLFFIFLIIGPLTGGLFALKSNQTFKNTISLFLSFAGAYLLSITLLNLIPEVFEELDPYKGILVLVGFFFQVFLEKYSQGIEHGHIHLHKSLKSKVVPLGIVISLSVHSFTEGIPLGAMVNQDFTKFISLLIGIAIHEVPAAFALISILKFNKISVKKISLVLVFYSSMSAIGAFTSYFLETRIDTTVFNYFLAFIIGTFLHISTTILFESSEQHKFSAKKLIGVILGLGIAILISLI